MFDILNHMAVFGIILIFCSISLVEVMVVGFTEWALTSLKVASFLFVIGESATWSVWYLFK